MAFHSHSRQAFAGPVRPSVLFGVGTMVWPLTLLSPTGLPPTLYFLADLHVRAFRHFK